MGGAPAIELGEGKAARRGGEELVLLGGLGGELYIGEATMPSSVATGRYGHGVREVAGVWRCREDPRGGGVEHAAWSKPDGADRHKQMVTDAQGHGVDTSGMHWTRPEHAKSGQSAWPPCRGRVSTWPNMSNT